MAARRLCLLAALCFSVVLGRAPAGAATAASTDPGETGAPLDLVHIRHAVSDTQLTYEAETAVADPYAVGGDSSLRGITWRLDFDGDSLTDVCVVASLWDPAKLSGEVLYECGQKIGEAIVTRPASNVFRVTWNRDLLAVVDAAGGTAGADYRVAAGSVTGGGEFVTDLVPDSGLFGLRQVFTTQGSGSAGGGGSTGGGSTGGGSPGGGSTDGGTTNVPSQGGAPGAGESGSAALAAPAVPLSAATLPLTGLDARANVAAGVALSIGGLALVLLRRVVLNAQAASPKRLRRRRAVGIVVVLTAITGGMPARSAQAEGESSYSGKVLYETRDCEKAKPRDVALGGAKVWLSNSGSRVGSPAQVQSDGSFVLTPDAGAAHGELDVIVALTNDRVMVGRDPTGGDGRKKAYALHLGKFERGTPRTVRTNDAAAARKIPAEHFNRPANVFRVIDDVAEVAKPLVPVEDLRQLPVRGRYSHDLLADRNDQDIPAGASYDTENKDMLVGGPQHRYEFNAMPLAHEYGHFVHGLTVRGDGPSAKGREHEPSAVYPDDPTLPFIEGFANAFAGIALNTDVLQLGCKPFIDLNTQTFLEEGRMPPNGSLAAYNEIAVASLIWHLAKHEFAGDDPRSGLKAFLEAMQKYAVDGPATTRQFVDALQVGKLERTEDGMYELWGRVLERGMDWQTNVRLENKQDRGETAKGANAFNDVSVRLEGPGSYADCRVPKGADPPEGEAKGSLDQTTFDDCFVSGGDGDPYTHQHDHEGAVRILYPYLAGGKHLDGEFTVWARYVCEQSAHIEEERDKCTESWRVGVQLTNVSSLPQAWAAPFSFELDLPRGKDVKLLTFTGEGKCTIVPTGKDCTV